ncbi:PadR family transcriptional regulator [Microterricola viridarii]|uniref:Transcriptional regulator PadR-like family protein n=1 Tax=Microterricola viridarii TaxID=412690 RepID=A0A1H1V5E5_9MICO|nr:PadR family transcriptional regulator [Microterricola viridarii]SDS79967.1 Transcriptional regulator PadR-like family protein [Microterricola viridarii]
MSVRESLLAVLTLGPAYGAQLHAELLSRLGHRRDINVGQIYATLDRLGKSALVRDAGATADGLPLYALTPSGTLAAREWLSVVGPGQLDWNEMLDQLLVASSLPGAPFTSLLAQHRELWAAPLLRETEPESAQGALAAASEEELRAAALRWLDACEAAAANTALARPLSESRPRRGRRPAA